MDSTSTNVGFQGGNLLERVADDGSVLQTATPVTPGLNFSQSLRWQNASPNDSYTESIRIQNTACTIDCTGNDVYRIRVYETTYSIPRFSNAGTQSTYLVVQNPTPYPISGNAYFWSEAGSLLYTAAISIAARQSRFDATAVVPALAGRSGSITVSHNGRYGSLSGKAVTVETATGYSFDTPMVPLPN